MGVSRRQDQNVSFVKNVNILEFGYYIWNHYEKCIQKSPNMPGIGSLNREIDVNISENVREKKNQCGSVKPMPAF